MHAEILMLVGCRYFLQGFCREGSNCKFAHRDPGSVAFSSAYTSMTPPMSSPFSGLAASVHMPSATSLMDPALAYHNGPMAPIAPVPQALADPVLSATYTSDSLSSGGLFSFAAARPQDVPFLGSSLESPLPVSSRHVIPVSTASSANGSATPTAATGTAHDRQLSYKQSPFPGVGTGVIGSSPFKFTEQQKYSGWPVSQAPF